MKISELGEFGLIRKVRKASGVRSGRVRLGIGDDAAVLHIAPSEALLATTDMLLEGVHFDLTFIDFYSLGWKSAAVNLSDIAAMGGRPRFCLTSLGIPPASSVESIERFYQGFGAVLKRHKTVLVGGDTCSSREGFVVSVTVLGETVKKRFVARSGAEPGDRIFITGPLGGSSAGLELLQSRAETTNRTNSALTEKHLRPVPRVDWGVKLAHSGVAHAMIDISDGLSSDLFHLCEESKVGAVLDEAAIPVLPQLLKASARLNKPPVEYALNGGEDYELLFTAPPAKLTTLRSLGIPLYEIGEITRGRPRIIIGNAGRNRALAPAGYDHFPGNERDAASAPGRGKRSR